jgi:ribonuclease HI
MGALQEERKRVIADLRRSLDRQRAERIKRWKERVNQLWHTRPGAVYRWLEDDTPAWGTTPIVNQEGRACSTPEEVDTEVRRFWVDEVLRKHEGVDGEAAWEGFAGSEFAAHIPRAEWPVVVWDGSLVRKTLGRMRASASPGSRGVPIAVWKAMPEEWHEWIARLLGLVEEEGQWPEGTLDAYVAMIPKASGGSRPQDQRPITVLDVMYRMWAKAQVEAWSPVMQREVLGEAAMGFRWESGTRNVAQLVTDVAEWQRMRGKPVWMVSFDVAKCYDTIPWWAVFGVMEAAGMSQRVVATFRDFYTRLRRRFRYGVLDGGVWQATNGLAQGCPASPDLLNLLYEGFHRWARAKGYGVAVGECVIPSASFADDVGLMGETWREVLPVVVGYLDFVARILLAVQVKKTQVWTSDTKACGEVEIAGVKVVVADSFRMVGIELGNQEKRLVTKHLEARLAKAVRGVERLRALAVPHAIASRIWNARIVPQVVYGCEVVAVTGLHLNGLIKAGRAMAASKTPIRVSGYRATEVFSGQPLGESRLADPMLVVRKRQLSWLQVLLNGGGLVGWVHRRVCGLQVRGGIRWHERTVALQQALDAMGWKVVVNRGSARARAWPALEPEPTFRGQVLLKPCGEEAGAVAAWTDGSLRGSQGGAAALLSVQGVETRTTMVAVADARSSTQCELVALGLAVGLHPEVVYSDSLTSLHLIRRWGQTSTAGALRCADRVEVRAFIIGCERRGVWPVLEKVKAHDAEGCSAGDVKALGNDRADALAKEAVDAERAWKAPVEADDAGWFVRGHGIRVANVDEEAERAWWMNQRKDLITRRPWMEGLYGVEVDWEVSCWAFRAALGKGGYFYPVQPSAVKWLARVRSGALATRARLFKTKLRASPECELCEHPTEDDAHAVMGCPATGADRWKDAVLREWETAAQGVPSLRTAVPSEEWLSSHGMRLCAGLIPVDARRWVEGDEGEVKKFLKAIHLAMTRRLAELMRRREELMAGNQGRARAPSGNQAAWQTITTREVVAIERVAQQLPSREEEPSVPRRGQARAKWLKGRLAQLLREHTEPRGEGEEGTTARELLEAFETTVGERFEESPGMGLTRRMTSISLVISKLAKGGELGFEMVGKRVVMTGGGYIVWSRCCTIPVEGERWFERQQAAERDEPPVATLRVQRLEVNASLGQWLSNHVKLRALEDAEEGTPSLVLLVLWEVDHGRPFPTSSSDVRNKVASFTRRMHEAVRKDKRLAWLTSKAVKRPLLVGLTATRQVLWAVGLRQPMGEAFDAAWRELGAKMFAEGARPGGKRGAATRMRLAEPSTTAAPVRVAEAPARTVVEGRRDSAARSKAERSTVRERRAARARRKGRKKGKSSRAEMEGARETAPPAKRRKMELRESSGKRKRKKKRRRAMQEGDDEVETKRAKLGGGARGWVAVRGRRRGKKREADSQADGRRRKRTRTSHGARHGRAQEGPPS